MAHGRGRRILGKVNRRPTDFNPRRLRQIVAAGLGVMALAAATALLFPLHSYRTVETPGLAATLYIGPDYHPPRPDELPSRLSPPHSETGLEHYPSGPRLALAAAVLAGLALAVLLGQPRRTPWLGLLVIGSGGVLWALWLTTDDLFVHMFDRVDPGLLASHVLFIATAGLVIAGVAGCIEGTREMVAARRRSRRQSSGGRTGA